MSAGLALYNAARRALASPRAVDRPPIAQTPPALISPAEPPRPHRSRAAALHLRTPRRGPERETVAVEPAIIINKETIG